MKVKIILIAFLIFVLSGGGLAMAQSGGQNGKSDNTMQGMDMSGKDKNMDMSNMDMSGSKSGNDMQGMDMSGSKNVKDSNSSNDMPGMDMGSDKPIKETPPNMQVLGAFGAVNLFFILIGIWNKWFKRKDGLNVSSK